MIANGDGGLGRMDSFGEHQNRYKEQETPKPVFALSENNSVTWVALVGGIGDHPHQNHLVQSVSLGNRRYLRARQKNPRRKVKIIAPYGG